MDRWRAAGALLALAACIASSAAAPTASNQTALDLYEGVAEGCYYNFQHYGEGDRIMTNEPCLNCTCHNRMLMCYLRVCPFTKAIGQDCTVEKRADQCCPIVTCPDVPVDLLTSTSTTSPAEYGATGLGKLDKYGCSINGKYFPEGSKVPPTPNKPCEHCYCIRNMTTCVMQECTLHVDGCTPIYHKDVCCPVRYSCDHPEDEVPLLDDMSTTVRPTPGFLLTTTTVAPVTQMTQDCVHEDKIFADGALIKTEKACEHCYCMKGDIVCVVQECGAPMENEGKNCTSLPPREGQCCPDTYICEGDELTSDIPTESTTESIQENLTTLSPPRRSGIEGSGYRNEPDEAPYTEMPTIESEVEGSGEEEQETSKPLGPDEIIPVSEDGEQYMYVSTKSPVSEEHDQITDINQNVFPDLEEKSDKPQTYPITSTAPPKAEMDKSTTSGIPEEDILELHEHVPTTSPPGSYERVTTDLGEALNTVPDVIPEEEFAKRPEYAPSTTDEPLVEENGTPIKESEKIKPLEKDQDFTTSDHSDTLMHEYTTPISISSNEIEKEVSTSAEILNVTPGVIVEKDHSEADMIDTTSATTVKENASPALQESEEKEEESSKPEQFAPSTTSYPLDENVKLTTEPDHAENTVAVAEEDTTHPNLHVPMTTIALPSVEEERTTVSSLEENIVTDKVIIDDVHEPDDYVPTEASALGESELTTAKPERDINTIPSEIDEKTSSEPPLPERTTLTEETKATESSIITGEMQTHVKPTTVLETATQLPESIVTKGDQYTITTEPSFRKEDESSVSSEKPKDFVPSTDRSEFVDEGLIPTSDHDDKTSSDIPSTEEEYTTSVPEYITTQSILETSVVTENLSSKVPELSSEQYGEVSLSTEKIADVTASVVENVETTEEPSRIPGEGDCLLNGVTYRNNTVVPSTNNCHSGCRCASSIIKCDPIICSPPPDYMDNCQSIYDSSDSCCPTYVCDHPRETVPPQSDNQMSGTESPMPTPTIECRGDQCEISEPAKQPSELCPSGSCLSEDDHKPHIQCGPEGCGELSQISEPSLSSVEKAEECKDGKCKPESCVNGDCQLPPTHIQVSPIKPCEGNHCETGHEVTQPSSPELCKNDKDCKVLEVPIVQTTCEGESCKKIDCGDGGCISDVVPHDSQPQNIPVQGCTGDEPCRRKEITASDEKLPSKCEGSNCKHQSETSDVQNVDNLSTELPFKEATEKLPTSDDEVTELPESQISTEDKVDDIPAKDTKETDTYTTESLVEMTEVNKEQPSVTKEPTKKPTIYGEVSTVTPLIIDKTNEEQTTVEIESTAKPTGIETDITESYAIVDKETETDKPAVLVKDDENKPIDEEEKSTEKPAIDVKGTESPALIDDEGKEKPTISEMESTEIPAAVEKEGTQLPTVVGEITENPATVDEEAKEKPAAEDNKDVYKPVDEEAEEKPVLVDENEPGIEETKEPAIVEEGTTLLSTFDGQTTDKPAIIDKEGTEVPAAAQEKDTEQPSLVHEEGKEKPADIDQEGTEKPVIVEEGTKIPPMDNEEDKDKPTLIDEKDMDTDKLSAVEALTKEPVTEIITEKLIESEGTEQPAVFSENGEEKPSVIDEKATKKPDILKDDTTKPDIDEERLTSGELITTQQPIETADKNTEKSVIDEEGKEKPSSEIEKEKPVIDNDATEEPISEEDIKNTPELVDEKPEIPTVSVEEGKLKPDLVDEEKNSESPFILTEESTEEPIMAEENDTKKPAMVEEDDKEKLAAEKEGTKKPLIVGEESTEKPIIIDEDIKEKPAVVDTEGNVFEVENTKKPDITEVEDKTEPLIQEKEITDKPATIEEESTEEPAVVEKEDEIKPIYVEREGTAVPAIVEEETTKKPSLIDETATEKPTKFDEESTDQPAVDEIEFTKEPAYIEKEGTDMPSIVKDVDTEKPLIDEEGHVRPSIEGDDTDKPVLDVKDGTDKPIVVEKEGEIKPAIIDEQMKEKPTFIEGQSTEKPEEEEEGSGTLIPEIHTDKPEKELKVPELIAQTTETTVSEIDKISKTPIYESQTTSTKDVEYAYTTQLNIAESFELSTTPQETPAIIVTEAAEIDSKVPVILEHFSTPETVTGSLIEELTTKVPMFATTSREHVTTLPEKELVTVSSISEIDVETTSPTADTTDIKETSETTGQDAIIDEGMQSTKIPELQESEPIEKTTESGYVSKPEEVFTDTSDTVDTPTTTAPGVSLIEPQEESERPDLPIPGETEEESTTKLYEQEKIKPIPESHVTEVTSATPEQSDISGSKVPEIKDKLEPESHDQHITKPDKITTQVPDEVDIKTDQTEKSSPNKEAITTETPAFSVTEPVRRFTEIEDQSITGQEDIVTGHPEKSTEYHVISSTEKIDESLDIKTTSLLPEETSVTTESEKEKPATDIPISVVTETQEMSYTSEKDVTSHEEKSTSIPDISDGYKDKHETSTEIPQYHVTETQETSTKPGEKEGTQMITTDVPNISVKEEEIETKAPEIMYTEPPIIDKNEPSITEMQKQPTELPTPEDVRTETPGVHVTSEVPQSLVTEYQEPTVAKEEITPKPELITTQTEEITKATEVHIPEHEKLQTETPFYVTDSVELTTKATKPDITEQDFKLTRVPEDAVTEKLSTLRETPAVTQEITESPESYTKVPEVTTIKQIEEGMKSTEYSSPQTEFSETTPYLIELEEHTHKIVEDISTVAPSEEEHTYKPVEDISTSSPSAEEHTYKIEESPFTIPPFDENRTTLHPEAEQKPQISELTTKSTYEEIGTTTKEAEATSKPSEESLLEDVSEKSSESLPVEGTTQVVVHHIDNKYTADDKEYTTSPPIQISEETTPLILIDSDKLPTSESSDIAVPTEKEASSSEKPLGPIVSHQVTVPKDEFVASTAKTTTIRQEEETLAPVSDDKLAKPEEIPMKASELPVSSTTTEVPKPSVSDIQPTDELPAPEEEGHFPPSGTSGYGEPEPDYVEEDQIIGPGTCRYGGKVYVSAQQIPRDDPCDFCFCFRSDIICLQQSCPPPIHGCHEEPIQGFCCPRYECPVSMATTVNVTTTTTTTTTTLPPHFPTHSYKGAAQRRGCQIKGHTYKVGEVVRSSSGPCLHCTCGGDGQMKCDPKACTPEPMLRQMIAAAVSAKRRR